MKKTFFIITIILSFLLVLSLPAKARQAYLSDIIITNNKDFLLAYFTVTDCFTPEMNSAIESGLNTAFTFFIQLYEKRDYWFNRKLEDIEINHTVKYDNLKGVYEITLSEENNKVFAVTTFDEARRLMAEVVALKVTSLQNLKKGSRYQLRMMAQLDKIRLPFYLDYVLFFLTLWDFDTDWYAVDFRY